MIFWWDKLLKEDIYICVCVILSTFYLFSFPFTFGSQRPRKAIILIICLSLSSCFPKDIYHLNEKFTSFWSIFLPVCLLIFLALTIFSFFYCLFSGYNGSKLASSSMCRYSNSYDSLSFVCACTVFQVNILILYQSWSTW